MQVLFKYCVESNKRNCFSFFINVQYENKKYHAATVIVQLWKFI